MQKSFHVQVRRDASVSDSSSVDFEQEVKAQSAIHAAASGLSLLGGDYADYIQVTALRPVPGRPAMTTFRNCSQGVYGFCFECRS